MFQVFLFLKESGLPSGFPGKSFEMSVITMASFYICILAIAALLVLEVGAICRNPDQRYGCCMQSLRDQMKTLTTSLMH